MNAPIFEYNFIVHTFCRLKEKTDRAKKARILISNRDKIKNFIIEFEINGKVMYETVDNKDDVETLSEIVKLFYSNYFDIITSSFYALGFEISSNMDDISLKYDNYHVGRIGTFSALSHKWTKEYKNPDSSDKRMENVYSDTVELDRIPFINSCPNFLLTFNDISLELDVFIEILNKIKEEFSSKKIEDIYNDALDEFIRMLNMKRERDGKDLSVLVYNISIMIYYNFKIVFRHDKPETAFLSFKEVGWASKQTIKEQEAAIYVTKESSSKIENISKQVADQIKKKHSVTKEYAMHVIGYILYQCVANIVMISREKYYMTSIVSAFKYEKLLKQMFFAKFMESIKAYMNLHSTPRFSDEIFKRYCIAIPRNNGKLLISSKQKIILLFIKNLFTIIKHENNYQKIKNELVKYKSEILSKEEDALYFFISRYYSEEYKRFSIAIYYYDVEADYSKKVISIQVQDMQEYYYLDIMVRSNFYQINNKLFENLISSIFTAPLSEAVGINKHNYEFFLKSIKAEFVNFD